MKKIIKTILLSTLIAGAISVNAADSEYPLHEAVGEGNETEVARLLERGADVNTADTNGTTALMIAVARGFQNIAQSLLKRGARMDAVDKNGETVLIKAACNDKSNIALLLLNHGARDSMCTKNALSAAAHNGSYTVAQLLLDWNDYGYGSVINTALTNASRSGHHDMVTLLLEYKEALRKR